MAKLLESADATVLSAGRCSRTRQAALAGVGGGGPTRHPTNKPPVGPARAGARCIIPLGPHGGGMNHAPPRTEKKKLVHAADAITML